MVVDNKIVDNKIIQIVCTYPPYKGGTGSVAFNFQKYLKRLYDINLLTLTPRYKKEKSDDKYLKYLLAWPKLGNAAFVPSIYKYLKNSDIVLLHMPFFGAVETILFYYFVSKFSKRRSKLFIYYHQDANISYGIRKYIFKFYNKFIHPLVFKIADRILVSSLDYAQNSSLKKIYLKNSDKFRAVVLGVDTSIFFPLNKESDFYISKKEKFNIKNGKKYITFVGGLGESHYFKGVPFLLEAIRILKEKSVEFEKVFLLGSGNLVDKYKKIVIDKNINDKVEIITDLDIKELNFFYNISSVNVLPSQDTGSEVFGLVSVEAMATKTPAIASNIYGVRTVIKDGETGYLLSPEDTQALAKKLEKILVDDELQKKLGENAYKSVLQKFTWEKTVENLKNIIDEV